MFPQDVNIPKIFSLQDDSGKMMPGGGGSFKDLDTGVKYSQT